MALKHLFQSAIPDVGDPTLVEPSDWNADHVACASSMDPGSGRATVW